MGVWYIQLHIPREPLHQLLGLRRAVGLRVLREFLGHRLSPKGFATDSNCRSAVNIRLDGAGAPGSWNRGGGGGEGSFD